MTDPDFSVSLDVAAGCDDKFRDRIIVCSTCNCSTFVAKSKYYVVCYECGLDFLRIANGEIPVLDRLQSMALQSSMPYATGRHP